MCTQEYTKLTKLQATNRVKKHMINVHIDSRSSKIKLMELTGILSGFCMVIMFWKKGLYDNNFWTFSQCFEENKKRRGKRWKSEHECVRQFDIDPVLYADIFQFFGIVWCMLCPYG